MLSTTAIALGLGSRYPGILGDAVQEERHRGRWSFHDACCGGYACPVCAVDSCSAPLGCGQTAAGRVAASGLGGFASPVGRREDIERGRWFLVQRCRSPGGDSWRLRGVRGLRAPQGAVNGNVEKTRSQLPCAIHRTRSRALTRPLAPSAVVRVDWHCRRRGPHLGLGV